MKLSKKSKELKTAPDTHDCCNYKIGEENLKGSKNIFLKFYHFLEKQNLLFSIIFANLILLVFLRAVIPGNEFLTNLLSDKNYFSMIIATLAMLILFPKFLLGTIRGLRNKTVGMLFTITISSSIAYTFSLVLFILNETSNSLYSLYFDAGVAILVFLSFGTHIEERLHSRSAYDIKSILKLKDPKVTLDSGNIVSLDTLKAGNIVRFNQHSDILIDGVLKEGKTYVSESFLTGEAKPISKKVGDRIFAGSINLGKSIVVEVEKTLEHSNISRIVKQSQQLSKSKAKVQRIADKVAVWLIIIEFIAVIITFLVKFFAQGESAIDSVIFSISVLVIACPCALGILTPGILLVSSSFLNKKNILIKNKNSMDAAKNIKFAAFDKTGTVVSSKLEVYSWRGDERFISIIKAMEVISEHPYAKAFLNYKLSILPEKIENITEEIGIGIVSSFNGNTYHLGGKKLLMKLGMKDEIANDEVVLIENNSLVASFKATSKINPKLAELVALLKEKGIEPILISGDKQESVKKTANELGFDKYYYEMSPEGKADVISDFQKEGRVLYIGDGINDIVAMSRSDISVSVATDYNAFNVPSDVVVFNDEVANVFPMLDILKKTKNHVLTGLLWSLFYNFVAIILVIILAISPIIAAAVMVGSDLFVMFLIFVFKSRKLDKKEYYKKPNNQENYKRKKLVKVSNPIN